MVTIIGGVPMELPIMLGAGVCKTPASVAEYMHPDVPLGAVVTGSYTPEPREGNKGTLYAWVENGDSSFALNSFGMPNCGYHAAHRELSLQVRTHPLIVSIAAFSKQGFGDGQLLFARNTAFVDAVEINTGCPNAHEEKTEPFANDFDSMSGLLELCSRLHAEVPVWLKLSPYITTEDLAYFPADVDISHVPLVSFDFPKKMATLIASYAGLIRAVVTTNTVGNCVYRRKGAPVTTPNGGKAGMSGPTMKQFALRQTKIFRDALPSSIDVIGCGGIMTGDDVYDYLKIGATGVQCTTLPYQFGGPKVFADLISGSEKLQQLLNL